MSDSEETKESESEEKAGLVEESDVPQAQDNFDAQLQQTLHETEQAVLTIDQIASDPRQTKSWVTARYEVEEFQPVPWFIWRLSNFVLGRSGKVQDVTEGLVFGLRRLLFAAASDEILGVGEKVNKVRTALRELEPDVIAAVAVIHAVCRKLQNKPHERIWHPILEDAVLRARIGFVVGGEQEEFGPGRGMLAGFAGRAGLAVLIASGELEQARKALEMLATGESLRNVGLAVYECDPLQVSAMILSASGCGRDSAFGTVSYASSLPLEVVDNQYQLQWLAAFAIIEGIRIGEVDSLIPEYWTVLNLNDEQVRSELLETTKLAIRRGHSWTWLIG